ncbi:alpha/beta fold hydrolase [Micromonospora sp. NPDC048835]|uniref:alpha/beta fold hydrolase n=1 Tax=Micromonospora sp. NPDC048835 TaxID=3155147 RepID=UPI0033E8C9B4
MYLAAFIPDAGEAVGQLVTRFPGSTVNESLKAVPLTGGQVDLYIDPAVYHTRFAADVPVEDATVYAIMQRPAAAAAFGEPVAGPQAWTTIPSFTLISGADMIIPRQAQEFMAKRAGPTVRIVDDASHLVFVSHPETTVALIEQAAHETAR